jgi:hypothetical protein
MFLAPRLQQNNIPCAPAAPTFRRIVRVRQPSFAFFRFSHQTREDGGIAPLFARLMATRKLRRQVFPSEETSMRNEKPKVCVTGQMFLFSATMVLSVQRSRPYELASARFGVT